MFLRKHETSVDLGFFNRMSIYDLMDRSSNSRAEYFCTFRRAITDFTTWEKIKLAVHARKCDQLLRPYPALANIPWRFARIRDVERGRWFTFGDTIFVNDVNDVDLTKILIHEKVHIYQRQNPDRVKKIITSLGFRVMDRVDPFVRNNPDTDQLIYSYKNKQIGKVYYLRRGFVDLQTLEQEIGDHPYEYMAYEIEREAVGESPPRLLLML